MRITGMVIVFLFSGLVQASSTSQCGVHTWHDVISDSGHWSFSLKTINQQGYFVNSSCQHINQGEISSQNKLSYGFGFGEDVDFNIAYTLTVVKDENRAFQSKACVFVITANGPAVPDIKAISYHGAKCKWKAIPGKGEDFFVG